MSSRRSSRRASSSATRSAASRSSSGRTDAVSTTSLQEAAGGLAGVPGRLRARLSDPPLERPELGLGELGRVIAAPAVHEVVRLVDEEERVLQGRRLARTGERDDRVEHVVVVADHDVRVLGELERDLERADGLGAGLLEDGVGVEVAPGLEEPLEEAGRLHLRAVVLRVRAVVLVAEDDVVRAHALLGAEAHGPEGVALDEAERLDVDLLLGRLRRQDVEAPAATRARP